MKELRVAIFAGNYNHIRDGVSLTLNRLVAFLEERGIPVLVVGPDSKKPAFKHNGELVHTPSIPMLVPGRGEYKIATGLNRNARKRLKEFNPTILHTATPDGLGIAAFKWGRKNRIPVVTSYHTHFLSYVKYYALYLMPVMYPSKLIFQWFYKNVDEVYVPTQSMIDELGEVGIKGNMKIWARGIDLNLFHPSKRDLEWRRSKGFADNDIVVSFVSRLVWEKDLKTYMKSVSNLQKVNPKVRALIVGDGPARPEAEAMFPHGHFTGFATGEDLARAYASSDIFLFPSHTETFGNVTLEAMASGLPCIVADAIGSKSLVENGVNGFWAEKENEKEFTEKLEKIVSDESLRKSMAEESRKLALNYRWEDINSGLVENYKEVIDRAGTN
ncbi:MAG: glycosyltransferase family 1 protein [Balneolales bacterium]|nr:glycosyltransferase family 1 protein [Balneolales bacterium]